MVILGATIVTACVVCVQWLFGVPPTGPRIFFIMWGFLLIDLCRISLCALWRGFRE